MMNNFGNANGKRYGETEVRWKSDESVVHAELSDKMKYSECYTPTFYRDLYTNGSPALQIGKAE